MLSNTRWPFFMLICFLIAALLFLFIRKNQDISDLVAQYELKVLEFNKLRASQLEVEQERDASFLSLEELREDYSEAKRKISSLSQHLSLSQANLKSLHTELDAFKSLLEAQKEECVGQQLEKTLVEADLEQKRTALDQKTLLLSRANQRVLSLEESLALMHGGTVSSANGLKSLDLRVMKLSRDSELLVIDYGSSKGAKKSELLYFRTQSGHELALCISKVRTDYSVAFIEGNSADLKLLSEGDRILCFIK